MASASRVSRIISHKAPVQVRNPYICSYCRSSLIQVRRSPSGVRHASDSKLPTTEWLRRKIWGTDNPPGLKDPYGGPSFLERRRMRNQPAADEQLYEDEVQKPDDYSSKSQRDTAAEPSPLAPRAPPEEYQPAKSWDGLQHYGHTGHWRDMAPRPEDQYTPWVAATPATNRAELLSCLYQAIVECLLSKQTGQKLNDSNMGESSNAFSSKIILESGTVTRAEDNNFESTNSEAQMPLGGQPLDEGFLQGRLDFSDPVTFAIIKRFTSLSGHRIPDPLLNSLSAPNSTKTLGYLLDRLTQRVGPRPKNLAETLMQKQCLTDQSNIMILPRRETPVDKEKEVGRWKVIENELKSRRLPVLGRVAA